MGYRVQNYAMEIPSRFKKEIAFACASSAPSDASFASAITKMPAVAASDRTIAVEGIENLLRNIGVFGNRVSHDDVETIVSEIGGGGGGGAERIRADKIILELL